MIVVSDTTAITSLLKIDRVSLLAELFGQVLVPPAVFEELRRYHGALPAFVEVRALRDPSRASALRADLDEGEAQAIALALESKADVLLIDEKRGRVIAEQKGVRCLGLAGALLLAKQASLIPSLRDLLQSLETAGNFYLDRSLKTRLIALAGEAEVDPQND